MALKADKWYNVLVESMSPAWQNVMIGTKKRRDTLREVLNAVYQNMKETGKDLCPPQKYIFRFCEFTPFEDIRVVIVGQDPYPSEHACGLCFSSEEKTLPASFRHIAGALKKSKLIPSDHDQADLRSWAAQGILLINTAFSTLMSEIKSHTTTWKPYTELIIRGLARDLDRRPTLATTVWLLWGKEAQKYKQSIEDEAVTGRTLILEWGHPSPGYPLNNTDDPKSFVNCDHFKRVREITQEDCETPLSWNTFSSTIECFTDGSANPNQACPESKGGYAIRFVTGPIRGKTYAGRLGTNEYKGETLFPTNNRAEGTAILRAIEIALTLPDCWNTLHIKTDSEFMINCITKFLPKWEVAGTIDAMKNPDINHKLLASMKILHKRKKGIIFTHIPAHTTAPDRSEKTYASWFWNNLVDVVSKHVRDNFEPATEVGSFTFMKDYMADDDAIPQYPRKL